MKKILLGTSLLVLCLTGCTSRYQTQVEQTLLLQENQRLEDALYVTHAQLVDLKRENESLKNDRQPSGASSSVTPTPKARKAVPVGNDQYDDAPPYQPIQIDIPKGAPESNTLPEALKSSQSVPIPNRPTPMKAKGDQKDSAYPELILPGINSVGEQRPPAWSPNR